MLTGRGSRPVRRRPLGRAWRATLGAAAAVGLATALAGCTWLGMGLYPPLDPDAWAGAGEVEPFTAGRATIAIDGGSPVILDQVETSSWPTTESVTVRWSNGEGWYLTIDAFSFPGEEPTGVMSIDRVEGASHRRSEDSIGCEVDLDWTPGERLAGSLTCPRLDWVDALSLAWEPPSMAARFAADVTFEARP